MRQSEDVGDAQSSLRRSVALRVEPAAQSQAEPTAAIASEPFAYGIGSDHWPGVGKVLEEQNELGTVLGKLFGSGGERHHWSGDLVRMMQDEIADCRAALRFLEDVNVVLAEGRSEHGFHLTDGSEYMSRREQWKLDLFHSWQRNEAPECWPQPQHYGLPSREQTALAAGSRRAKTPQAVECEASQSGDAKQRNVQGSSHANQ